MNRAVQIYRGLHPEDTRPDHEITVELSEKYPEEFQKFDDAVRELNEIRNAAIRSTLSPMDYVKNAAGSFVRGFGNTVASLPKAIGIGATSLANTTGIRAGQPEDPEETASWKVGQWIEDTAAAIAPETQDALSGSMLWSKIPGGVGSTLGFLVGGGAGGMAVKGAGGVAAKGLLGYVQKATPIAVLGAAAGGTGGYESAVAEGAPKEVAAGPVFWQNALVGTSEVAPIGKWLDRMDAASGGLLQRTAGKMLRDGLVETAEEAIQEAVQQFAQNFVAKRYYDKDRDLLKDLGENAAVGGATGFIFSMLTQGISNRLGANAQEQAANRKAREQRQQATKTTTAKPPPQQTGVDPAEVYNVPEARKEELSGVAQRMADGTATDADVQTVAALHTATNPNVQDELAVYFKALRDAQNAAAESQGGSVGEDDAVAYVKNILADAEASRAAAEARLKAAAPAAQPTPVAEPTAPAAQPAPTVTPAATPPAALTTTTAPAPAPAAAPAPVATPVQYDTPYDAEIIETAKALVAMAPKRGKQLDPEKAADWTAAWKRQAKLYEERDAWFADRGLTPTKLMWESANQATGTDTKGTPAPLGIRSPEEVAAELDATLQGIFRQIRATPANSPKLPELKRLYQETYNALTPVLDVVGTLSRDRQRRQEIAKAEAAAAAERAAAGDDVPVPALLNATADVPRKPLEVAPLGSKVRFEDPQNKGLVLTGAVVGEQGGLLELELLDSETGEALLPEATYLMGSSGSGVSSPERGIKITGGTRMVAPDAVSIVEVSPYQRLDQIRRAQFGANVASDYVQPEPAAPPVSTVNQTGGDTNAQEVQRQEEVKTRRKIVAPVASYVPPLASMKGPQAAKSREKLQSVYKAKPKTPDEVERVEDKQAKAQLTTYTDELLAIESFGQNYFGEMSNPDLDVETRREAGQKLRRLAWLHAKIASLKERLKRFADGILPAWQFNVEDIDTENRAIDRIYTEKGGEARYSYPAYFTSEGDSKAAKWFRRHNMKWSGELGEILTSDSQGQKGTSKDQKATKRLASFRHKSGKVMVGSVFKRVETDGDNVGMKYFVSTPQGAIQIGNLMEDGWVPFASIGVSNPVKDAFYIYDSMESYNKDFDLAVEKVAEQRRSADAMFTILQQSGFKDRAGERSLTSDEAVAPQATTTTTERVNEGSESQAALEAVAETAAAETAAPGEEAQEDEAESEALDISSPISQKLAEEIFDTLEANIAAKGDLSGKKKSEMDVKLLNVVILETVEDIAELSQEFRQELASLFGKARTTNAKQKRNTGTAFAERLREAYYLSETGSGFSQNLSVERGKGKDKPTGSPGSAPGSGRDVASRRSEGGLQTRIGDLASQALAELEARQAAERSRQEAEAAAKAEAKARESQAEEAKRANLRKLRQAVKSVKQHLVRPDNLTLEQFKSAIRLLIATGADPDVVSGVVNEMTQKHGANVTYTALSDLVEPEPSLVIELIHNIGDIIFNSVSEELPDGTRAFHTAWADLYESGFDPGVPFSKQFYGISDKMGEMGVEPEMAKPVLQAVAKQLTLVYMDAATKIGSAVVGSNTATTEQAEAWLRQRMGSLISGQPAASIVSAMGGPRMTSEQVAEALPSVTAGGMGEWVDLKENIVVPADVLPNTRHAIRYILSALEGVSAEARQAAGLFPGGESNPVNVSSIVGQISPLFTNAGAALVEDKTIGSYASTVMTDDGRITTIYNPDMLAEVSGKGIELAMREELIHVAHFAVIKQMHTESGGGSSLTQFARQHMETIAKLLPSGDRIATARVYEARNDFEVGSEYLRAVIQKARYGDITESYTRTALEEVAVLLRRIADFLKRLFTGNQHPVIAEAIRDVTNVLNQIEGGAVIDPGVITLSNGTMTGGPTVVTIGGHTTDARAYHGTPHDIISRFLLSKIGTGEGAQVYGWGLYFAQSREVAKRYAETLSGTALFVGGKKLPQKPPPKSGVAERTWNLAYEYLKDQDGDTDLAKNQLDSDINFLEQELAEAQDEKASREMGNVKTPGTYGSHPGDMDLIINTLKYRIQENNTAIDLISKWGEMGADVRKTGNIYTVELNVSDSELLDWSNKLGERLVRRIVESAPVSSWGNAYSAETAKRSIMALASTSEYSYQDLHRDLMQLMGMEPRKISELLRSLGYKGIKYLDQFSRVGAGGEPTYNYVIFDESVIQITEKNGSKAELESVAAEARKSGSLKRTTDPVQNVSAERDHAEHQRLVATQNAVLDASEKLYNVWKSYNPGSTISFQEWLASGNFVPLEDSPYAIINEINGTLTTAGMPTIPDTTRLSDLPNEEIQKRSAAHAHIILEKARAEMADRRRREEGRITRLNDQMQQHNSRVRDLLDKYDDADVVLRTALGTVKDLMTDLKDDIDLFGQASAKAGMLSQAIAAITKVQDKGVLRAYSNVINRLYAVYSNDPDESRRFTDMLQAAGELDINWSKESAADILAKLNAAAATNPDLAPIVGDSMEAKAITAILMAFARENHLTMNLLSIRRGDYGEELKEMKEAIKLAVSDSKMALDKARTMLRRLPKLGAKASRILDRLEEAKAERRRTMDEIVRAESFIEFHHNTAGYFRKELAKLETVFGAAYDADWEANDGAAYNVPEKATDSIEKVESRQKKVQLKAGMNAELKRDIMAMDAWLDAQPEEERGAFWRKVSRQVEQLRSLDMRDTHHAIRMSAISRYIGSISDRIGQMGTVITKQMVARFNKATSVMQAISKPFDEHGFNWSADAGTAMHKLGLKHLDEFYARYYEPVLKFLEDSQHILASATSWDDATDKGIDAALGYLEMDPDTAAQMDRPGARAALEAFYRRTVEANDATAKLAKRLGIHVKENRDSGHIFRDVLGHPLFHHMRTFNGLSKIMYNAMRPTWSSDTPGTNSGMKASVIAQMYNDDPLALANALAPRFSTETIQRFVMPIVYREKAAFYAPSSGGFRVLANRANIEAAFQRSGGNMVEFAEELFALEGGAGDIADYVGEVMETFQAFYNDLHKVHSDDSASSARGMPIPPRVLMSARFSEEMPQEWMEFQKYDQHSMRSMSKFLAYEHAFGYDMEGIYNDFKSAITEQRELAASFEEIEKMAEYTTKGMGKRAYNAELKRLAEHRGGPGHLIILKQADRNAQMLDNLRNEFKKFVQRDVELPLEFRSWMEIIGAMAGATVQGIGTALVDTISLIDGPLRKYGINPVSLNMIKQEGKTFLSEALNSFLQVFNATVQYNTDYVKRRVRLGFRDMDATMPFKRKLLAAILQDTDAPKAMRPFVYGARALKTAISSGFGKAKPGDEIQYTTFKPVAVFTQATQLQHLSAIDGTWRIYEDLVARAVEHFESAAGGADLADPDFKFSAKDLGYGKGWFGLMDSSTAYNRMRDTLDGFGLNLEEVARSAVKRRLSDRSAPLFSEDAYVRLASISQNEVTLESGLTTRSPGMINNPVLYAASPLLGWSVSRLAQLPKLFREGNGEHTWQSVRSGMMTMFLGLLPLSLAYAWLRDEYDEKVQGKKANTLQFGQENPFYVALDKVGRVGALGIAGDALNSVLNQDTNRPFSVDSRVFFIGSTLSALRAIGTWMRQGTADYPTVYRPLMQALGGSGYLQYVDILNNITSADNMESRVVARINASNYLRTAGRGAGLDVRVGRSGSGGMFDSMATPAKPFLGRMWLSAIANDPVDFRNAYNLAVDAAREMGKEDPRKYVADAFSEYSPLRSVFRTMPTEREYKDMLASMTDQGQEAVTSAIRMFNWYANQIGARPAMGTKSKLGSMTDLNIKVPNLNDIRRRAAMSLEAQL